MSDCEFATSVMLCVALGGGEVCDAHELDAELECNSSFFPPKTGGKPTVFRDMGVCVGCVEELMLRSATYLPNEKYPGFAAANSGAETVLERDDFAFPLPVRLRAGRDGSNGVG